MTDRMRPEFLTVEDVLVIQRDQLARYGGDPGLRDLGLLGQRSRSPTQPGTGSTCTAICS